MRQLNDSRCRIGAVRQPSGGTLPAVMVVLAVVSSVLSMYIFVGTGRSHIASYAEGQTAREPLAVGELPLAVPHQFVFRNTTDAVLHVEKVEGNCSCTFHEISNNDIEPGQTAYLDMSMRMYQSGTKSTQVKVSWSTGEQTVYTLESEARAQAELGTSSRFVKIHPGESIEVDVWLSTLSNEAPLLTIDPVVSGYTVVSEPWKVISEGQVDSGISRRFASRLRISATPQVDSGSNVIVHVPGAQPLIITVNPLESAAPTG